MDRLFWNTKYSQGQSKLCVFVPRSSTKPLDMGLPRPAWVRLNYLCTGVGRFQSSIYKLGLAPTSICKCATLDLTAAHVIPKCPLHCALKGYNRMLVLNDETRCWLKNISNSILRKLPPTRGKNTEEVRKKNQIMKIHKLKRNVIQ